MTGYGVRSFPHAFESNLSGLQDEDWAEEEQQHQGFKEDEFSFLSEMLGPRGANFDNDDILYESDDEDLKKDPISRINMKVCVFDRVDPLG